MVKQKVPTLNASFVKGFSTTNSRLQEDELEESDEQPQNQELLMQKVSLETSMKYMKSKAYDITYGDSPVWVPYRRNHKGALPPTKTRKQCIRKGILGTGNPCPICRDTHLVVDAKNTDLLKQFVSEYSGELISYEKTGVCQQQHKKLEVELEKAYDLGLMEKPMPFRTYDYSQYYPELKKANS